MSERILESLEPVRRRQLWLEVFRSSAIGLLVGSLGAVVLAILRWQGAGSTSTVLAGACLVGGPLIGALFGVLRGRSFNLAAATVDRCYGLKDRAATAIDFVRRGRPTPLHVLQVADAEQHLAAIDARKVARLPLSQGDALRTGRGDARAWALALAATHASSRPAVRAARSGARRRARGRRKP